MYIVVREGKNATSWTEVAERDPVGFYTLNEADAHAQKMAREHKVVTTIYQCTLVKHVWSGVNEKDEKDQKKGN